MNFKKLPEIHKPLYPKFLENFAKLHRGLWISGNFFKIHFCEVQIWYLKFFFFLKVYQNFTIEWPIHYQ